MAARGTNCHLPPDGGGQAATLQALRPRIGSQAVRGGSSADSLPSTSVVALGVPERFLVVLDRPLPRRLGEARAARWSYPVDVSTWRSVLSRVDILTSIYMGTMMSS